MSHADSHLKPIKTYSAGGLIIGPQGKVLIASQYGTSWSLPKGHLENGEDALSAAKREIYEEAGIQDLTYVGELGSYERFRIGRDGKDETSELKHITIFMFRTSQVETAPQDPDNPEAIWVTLDELTRYLSHPADSAFIEKHQEAIRHAISH